MKLPRDEKGRLLPRGGFTKQVLIRISNELYEELRLKAKEKDLSVAEYTRELVSNVVKEQ
jgi:predicted HicB family RNase H-like nuclease